MTFLEKRSGNLEYYLTRYAIEIEQLNKNAKYCYFLLMFSLNVGYCFSYGRYIFATSTQLSLCSMNGQTSDNRNFMD